MRRRQWSRRLGRILAAVALTASFVRGSLAQVGSADSPLVTWEVVLPQRSGVALWVRNASRDTVWVDSIHVEACRNIRRVGCGTRELGVTLPPGAQKILFRLEPAVPRDPFSYQWSLDWRSAGHQRPRQRQGAPARLPTTDT
jgi:hypothetical protein